MYIYKVTNLVNGKIYIGQTSRSIEERWKGHKYHKGCHYLYRAIKKYGEQNFKIEIICSALCRQSLNSLEIDIIKQENSLVPNGYNICVGGNAPMKNREHTKETKKKISESMKKINTDHLHSEESIKKRVESFKKNGKSKGRPRSNDTKLKISKANAGKNHGMWGKRGFDCPNFKFAIECVETGQVFGSQTEAARRLDLQQSNIHKVLTGKRNHTGGYTFKKVGV